MKVIRYLRERERDYRELKKLQIFRRYLNFVIMQLVFVD